MDTQQMVMQPREGRYVEAPHMPESVRRALDGFARNAGERGLDLRWDPWAHHWVFFRLHERSGVDPVTGLWMPGGQKQWQYLFVYTDDDGTPIRELGAEAVVRFLVERDTGYSKREFERQMAAVHAKAAAREAAEDLAVGVELAEGLSRVITDTERGSSPEQALGVGKLTVAPGVSPGRSRGKVLGHF